MHIWLLATGEPWPTDGEAPRLFRTGLNASYLSKRGHDVLWWQSTFDHRIGIERPYRERAYVSPDGYRIIGLYGGGYKRNVSLRRLMYFRNMARHLRGLMAHQPKPDIIVAALTPLELSRAAVEYGIEVGCPVIVDVRDMWPDTWLDLAPAWSRPAARVALRPYYEHLRRAVRGATAITGITEPAVDWALDAVGRKRGPLERGFPLIYPATTPEPAKVAAAAAWWRERGVRRDSGDLIGCYFGALTVRADFDTPIRGLRELPAGLRSRIKLVLCGRGEAESRIKDLAAGMSEVIVPGWVDAAQIWALMEACAFGLLPYRPTLDYARSLPNKVFEYVNGGLPIATSLRGVIEEFFSENACGILYNADDPGSFRDAVMRLASAPEEVARLKAVARAAAAKYDAEGVCADFESYLTTVLSASSQQKPASARALRDDRVRSTN